MLAAGSDSRGIIHPRALQSDSSESLPGILIDSVGLRGPIEGIIVISRCEALSELRKRLERVPVQRGPAARRCRVYRGVLPLLELKLISVGVFVIVVIELERACVLKLLCALRSGCEVWIKPLSDVRISIAERLVRIGDTLPDSLVCAPGRVVDDPDRFRARVIDIRCVGAKSALDGSLPRSGRVFNAGSGGVPRCLDSRPCFICG